MTRPAITVREAEVHALTLWVEPECRALGDWVLRTVVEAPGLRLPRTNSCLAVGDPGLPIADAVGSVGDFYASIGRTPIAQVERGSSIEQEFLSAGWSEAPEDEASSFLLAPLRSALVAAGPSGRERSRDRRHPAQGGARRR